MNTKLASLLANFAKGILTDNNARKIERVKEKDYLSYSYDELHTTLASVKETIGESSLTGTAIQYCLHNKTVAAVIPGASSLQQLQENIRASQQLPLTKEEYVQLQKLLNMTHMLCIVKNIELPINRRLSPLLGDSLFITYHIYQDLCLHVNRDSTC